jgi:hypothetical protein
MIHSFSRRACKPRLLRLESLEQRELLAVTVVPGTETFKSFEFTGINLAIGGTWTVRYPPYPAYAVPFKGATSAFHGTAAYTSATQGAITIDQLEGAGKWTTPVSSFRGDFSIIGGRVDNGADNKGVLSGNASGTVDIDMASGADYVDEELSGPVSGSFNGPKQTVQVGYRQGDLSLKISGAIQPQADSPFQIGVTDAVLTQGVNGANPTLRATVEVTGAVHKAASYAKPVTYLKMYWAKGPNYVNRIGSPLADKIPIDWNEAGGVYEVSKLPSPPPTATHLVLIAQYDGKPVETVYSLALPERPALAIDNVQVSKPATGTADAVFTVTIPASLFPVKVSYATASGTAKAGIDYQAASGKLTFAPGETNKTITVKVKGATKANSKVNSDKIFYVKLKSPTWATLPAGTQGMGTITTPTPAASDAALAQWSTADAGADLAAYFAANQQRERDAAASFPV